MRYEGLRHRKQQRIATHVAIARRASTALDDLASKACLQVSRNAQTNVVAAGLAAREGVRYSHGSVQASVQGREKEKRPQIVDLRAFP
ncbi:hypothetical protein QE400_002869 [Xanthomonas sacchari]|uniref:hypothetical protein n=1 Tax=Xanthomonas sacchari TaxID=56458 RepID=UPI002786D6BC|nr:hypothetical protein [Xanthomonas sacchari]MDQ1093456.1 hypothetical protein [Xanthomonas sacchari]